MSGRTAVILTVGVLTCLSTPRPSAWGDPIPKEFRIPIVAKFEGSALKSVEPNPDGLRTVVLQPGDRVRVKRVGGADEVKFVVWSQTWKWETKRREGKTEITTKYSQPSEKFGSLKWGAGLQGVLLVGAESDEKLTIPTLKDIWSDWATAHAYVGPDGDREPVKVPLQVGDPSPALERPPNVPPDAQATPSPPDQRPAFASGSSICELVVEVLPAAK